VPLSEAHLISTVRTGIEFVHLPGCIPVFYEVSACNAANYRYFSDWQELSPDQQATIIAWYLSTIWLENNKNDAEYRHQLRQQQLSSLKGGK